MPKKFTPKQQVALSDRIDRLSLADQARVAEFVRDLHRPTPMAIAERIVDRFEVLHLSDLQGILDPNNEHEEPDGATNDSLYERLIRANNPKHDAELTRLLRMEESFKKQLTESLGKEFFELTERLEKHGTDRAEAAYLLGLAAGRRMAGGAR